jgi:hypothetical protein
VTFRTKKRKSKPLSKPRKKSAGFLKKQKPVQKHEEYPKIKWDNLADENVQMATILYNDRILSYRKLKQLDEQLDTTPTARSVMEMAETRIRNLQAFAELQSYNTD